MIGVFLYTQLVIHEYVTWVIHIIMLLMITGLAYNRMSTKNMLAFPCEGVD